MADETIQDIQDISEAGFDKYLRRMQYKYGDPRALNIKNLTGGKLNQDIEIGEDGSIGFGDFTVYDFDENYFEETGETVSFNVADSPNDDEVLKWVAASNQMEWKEETFIRPATKVIAASDSVDTANADYVCDGTDDQVQIQAAIDEISDSANKPGTILLMEGTFNISSPIVPKSYIQIKGIGWSSTLKAISGTTAIVDHGTGTRYQVNFKNLTFDGDNQGAPAFKWDDGTKQVLDTIIEGCYFYDFDGPAIKVTEFRGIVNENLFKSVEQAIDAGDECIITNNSVNTAGVATSSSNLIATDNYCVVDSNIIDADSNTSSGAITVSTRSVVSNNYIYNGRTAINFSTRCSIQGNVIYGADTNGILVNGAYSTISGNTIRGNNVMDYGITWTTPDHVTIVGNTISDCQTNGLYVAASRVGIVTGNTFQDNPTDIAINDECLATIFNNSTEDEYNEVNVGSFKNSSGSTIAQGDVVVIDDTANGYEIVHTTSRGDAQVLGVSMEEITDTNTGSVKTLGKTTYLKVDGTDDIAIGDLLTTFTSAGIACKASAGEIAFAIALEAYAIDDSNGVIDALLISPRAVSISSGDVDHSALTNLAWTSSGHTGTANTIAGYDNTGAASEYTASSPISLGSSTISIQDAVADSSTKGAATFDSDDFDSTNGKIDLEDSVLKIFSTDSGAGAPSGHTIVFAGGEGIDTSGSGSNVFIAGEDASDTNKGIASFDSNYFTVTAGDVAIDDVYVLNSGDTMTGALIIDGSADTEQLVVQAHSTQNDNIFEIQSSVAADLFTIDASGNGYFASNLSLQFRDAQLYVNSDNDGHLDLHADTSIDLNADVVVTDDITMSNATGIISIEGAEGSTYQIRTGDNVSDGISVRATSNPDATDNLFAVESSGSTTRFGVTQSTGTWAYDGFWIGTYNDGILTAEVGIDDDGSSGLLLYADETEQVHIHDDGIVDLNNQSQVKAQRRTDQTIASGSPVKVQFNVEIDDVQGEYDPTGNYRFTASKPGGYTVLVGVVFEETADLTEGEHAYLYLYKNGSLFHVLDVFAGQLYSGGLVESPSIRIMLGNSVDLELAAEDYLEVYTEHDAGANLIIDGSDDDFEEGNFFCVHKFS